MRAMMGAVALAAAWAMPAAGGELTGWGEFRFGMEMAEVLKAAGSDAQSGTDISGIPIVSWDATVFGEQVDVVAFMPNGKLEAVQLTLPEMAISSDRECFARLGRIIAELTKVHGEPDERSPQKVSDKGQAAWHAIFRFDRGAVITATSSLTDFDDTCSSELIYDSTP